VTRSISAVVVAFWSNHLQRQVFLGDDDFIERMQNKTTVQQRDNAEFPVSKRKVTRHKTLQDCLQSFGNTPDALAAAYRDDGGHGKGARYVGAYRQPADCSE
jgi:hypothetical protein